MLLNKTGQLLFPILITMPLIGVSVTVSAADAETRYVRIIPASVNTVPVQAEANAEPMVVTGESPALHATKATMDLLIARPLGVAGTALGAGLYIASFPVTFSTGTADAAGQSLIGAPFNWTFKRGLGEKSY